MTPREFFPHMPDEVFNTWIKPHIEKHGWPFNSLEDEVIGTKYELIFGKTNNLESWNGFHWGRGKIDIHNVCFHEDAITTIRAIIDNGTGVTHTFAAHIKESKIRFNTYARFASINGFIQGPILVTFENNKVVVIDGHHRLSGLIHSNPPNGTKVDVYFPTRTT